MKETWVGFEKNRMSAVQTITIKSDTGTKKKVEFEVLYELFEMQERYKIK